jgi:hypothetical protein
VSPSEHRHQNFFDDALLPDNALCNLCAQARSGSQEQLALRGVCDR